MNLTRFFFHILSFLRFTWPHSTGEKYFLSSCKCINKLPFLPFFFMHFSPHHHRSVEALLLKTLKCLIIRQNNVPKWQITCYDYSLLLEVFGKSDMHILYLWLFDPKEVFSEEFQQEIQWQPIRMSAVLPFGSSVQSIWHFSILCLGNTACI